MHKLKGHYEKEGKLEILEREFHRLEDALEFGRTVGFHHFKIFNLEGELSHSENVAVTDTYA